MQKKILIIEDSKTLLKFFKKFLESKGYEIYTAKNGFQGILSYEVNKPDMVLTDIIMPDMDGLEVIMRLKKEHPACKIIAMSAGGRITSEEYLKHAKIFGACSTLTKPFNEYKLLDEIEKHLN